MSRRNRNKFRSRDEARSTATTAVNSGAVSRPQAGNGGAFAQHAAEYKIISSDMIRLVILNGVMLVAVLALYYVNRSSGIVEKWFEQIIK